MYFVFIDVLNLQTKYITNEDQRKLIEADEAIDAIDSAMEFKNEMLCGRLGLAKTGLEERVSERSNEVVPFCNPFF